MSGHLSHGVHHRRFAHGETAAPGLFGTVAGAPRVDAFDVERWSGLWSVVLGGERGTTRAGMT